MAIRKVLLNVAVSLDGYIEGPDGEYDWCFTDQDYGLTEFLESTDAIFYGRKSYELFADYAPPENASVFEKNVAALMISKEKYVFSTTLKSVKGAFLISGNIKKEVLKIKNAPGKNIFLFGGAGLLSSFVNLDLVDEYHLAVHPVILGSGKLLFSSIEKRKRLTLLHTETYSTGLVRVIYSSSRN